MVFSPGTRIGHYEIAELVGAGGMGEVYRATDTVLKRTVAVKVFRDIATSAAQTVARFRREAEILASLNHPHIAQVYGLEQLGDLTAIVMEFVDGPTLAERIAQGPVPMQEAMAITRQLITALDAAHQRGIIHRDLKPANIKLRSDGTVKVLDFGLAKGAADGAEAVGADTSMLPTMTNVVTLNGVLMGTAAYMSPEQARGETVDRRADIWAFGVILHEMITGKRLFDGKTVADTVAAVLVADPDLSAIPPRLRPLLLACLDRDVTRRLRDIGDAWRLLEEQQVVEPRTAARHRATRWAAAALLAVAAGVAGFIIGRPTARDVKSTTLSVDLGTTLSPTPGHDVVISPDGTHLAYIGYAGILDNRPNGDMAFATGRGPARGRGGVADPPGTRLIVRNLTSSQTIEIAGTAGATRPFFSPDGRWISFAAQGKLNKVSIDGGAVLPLVALAGPVGVLTGVVWADDDAILFTAVDLNAPAKTDVFRLAAAGREPTKLTSVDIPGCSIEQLLPGGTHALITTYTGTLGAQRDSQNASIEALSLTDGRRKVLVRGATSPYYTATGHLLFVRQGTLLATPFDIEALEAGEHAEPILSDVEFARNGVTTYSISRDGTLVYRSGAEAAPADTGVRTRLAWVDAAGKPSALPVDQRPYSRPRLSPDGGKLAVLITEPDNRDEWVVDVGSGRMTRVTFGDLSVSTVAWSGDSKELFVGAGGTGIHRAFADGNQPPRHLMNVNGIVTFVTAFSPATNRLIYSALINPDSKIFSVPLSRRDGEWKVGTPEAFINSRFREMSPALSADGRWMAYTTDETGRLEVNVRPFLPGPGSNVKIPISTEGGENPRWGPNNDLLYESTGRILSVRYSVNGGTFVPEKKSTVRLEHLEAARGDWDIAADGRIIAAIPAESAPQETARAVTRTVTWVEHFYDELRRRVPTR